MQRLLWNERWACETAAFMYSFLLFLSEILKILFVVVKETSLSYVEVLSLLCTWTGTLRLIHCQNLPLIVIHLYTHIGTIGVLPSQICISNMKGFFCPARKSVAIENTIQLKKLQSIVYSFG